MSTSPELTLGRGVGAITVPAPPPDVVGGPLRPRTATGAALVEIVAALAPAIAERAAAHDRDGTFPTDGLQWLGGAGVLVAPVAEELGGLGVASLHDLVVAASRLASADASLAIGVNMHLVFVHNVALRWRRSLATGRERRADALEELLLCIAAEELVLAAAVSEPAQDVTRPATRATRVDGGWRVDGRKIFCTMAPAATAFYVAVSFEGDDGSDRYGYALVPADTPGITVHGDWDALGMRASGSHTVTFAEVEVPRSALSGGFRAGDTVAYLERNLAAGLLHAASSLGIAEEAHRLALATLGRRGGGEPRERHLAAESEIDLAATRALVARAAALVDECEGVAAGEGADTEVVSLFAMAQAAKSFANRAAERIADRSLAIAGGAGYLSASPLSRLYRDARAGAFMHPLGANRGPGVIASAALGEEPELR